MSSPEEQKQIVKDVSQTMIGLSKQAMYGYISTKVLTDREAISIMADIATEVYLQGLSDLAFISKGNDKSTKAFIKENNAIAKRKLVTVYDLKAKERDEVIKQHQAKPKLHRV